MMFVCPHCGANEFQLWAGVDGRSAIQCLHCGEASRPDQSERPEPLAEWRAPQVPETRN